MHKPVCSMQEKHTRGCNLNTEMVLVEHSLGETSVSRVIFTVYIDTHLEVILLTYAHTHLIHKKWIAQTSIIVLNE